MSKIDLVIKNGLVILENDSLHANIAVNKGKIVGIYDYSIDIDSESVLDASNLAVMPGCVDPHTHIWEPTEFEYREDFYTGSCAAASGGITTLVEMPLSVPPVKDKESFDIRLNKALNKSILDFSLWGAFIKDSISNFNELHSLGCVAYKAFLSHASDEYPRVDDFDLLRGMSELSKFKGIVGVHAENYQITDGYMKSVGRIVVGSDHERTRPEIAEIESISRAIVFAKHTGARLHICHLSTVKAYYLIEQAKRDGVDITVETCPHYLTLSLDDLDRCGGYAKCNPPLRRNENKEQLWKLIEAGKVDCIGSDHTPYTDEDRSRYTDIFKMPPGIGGIDLFLPLMISEGYNKRCIDLVRISNITATNAAKIMGIYPQKGAIKIGADADIVLVDLSEEWKYSALKSYAKSKCINSPYENKTIKGRVKYTILRGNLLFSNGKILAEKAGGQYVKPQI